MRHEPHRRPSLYDWPALLVLGALLAWATCEVQCAPEEEQACQRT